MAPKALWLTMLGMGALTYVIRLSLILLWERVSLPPAMARALRFVPPAVLSAIIFPEVLRHDGALNVSLGNVRLIAGVVALLVAWRTRSALLTIAAGMVVLWGMRAVGVR